MNHKLAESYIKDKLRKIWKDREVFCENGIAYIGAYIELDFEEDAMYLYGYKTQNVLILNYPAKDGYTENVLESIISIIAAQVVLEGAYAVYKEVI